MKIDNLTMSFGKQVLFENVNLIIDKYQKVGVVGVNGAGKTTFFKLLLGKLDPEEGKIILNNNERIGFLPQVISEEIPQLDITVFDYLMLGRPIEKLQQELESLYSSLTNANEQEREKLYNKINLINKKLDYWDVYNSENTLLKIIDGMSINTDLLDQKLNSLSGGQKSKVAFARLLYSKCELLLLDEPTNHLDNETKEFVISYLKKYNGSVYVISHDVDFLDEITTKILYLDKKTKTFELFDGNYSSFKRKTIAREQNLINQANIQNREIDKLKDIIGKYTNSSGKRKRMAQDREKKLEKLMKNKIDVPIKSKETKFEIKINRESGIIPLKVENLSFAYTKEKNIIEKLSFALYKGEKFLVVGMNGVGKSTLLKLLVGELKPDSGIIWIGGQTDIAYYAQEHEILDLDKNIIENFSDMNISERQLRSLLGNFLFFGDDIYKKVKVLSPGERCRVVLAKLSLSGANTLILDEPTNHLDPETQEIIASVFKSYKGTMLVVSHNAKFVNDLGVERTLTLPSGEISYYDEKLVKFYEEINSKKD